MLCDLDGIATKLALHSDSYKNVWLSWIQEKDEIHTLYSSTWDGTKWSQITNIHDSWFYSEATFLHVNDTPIYIWSQATDNDLDLLKESKESRLFASIYEKEIWSEPTSLVFEQPSQNKRKSIPSILYDFKENFPPPCCCKNPEASSPDPPGNTRTNGPVQPVGSSDPNDKIAPSGFGNPGFITKDTLLEYQVLFENKPEATAPAQQVIITDILDSDLDLETFELIEIAFADKLISVPEGLSHYETTVDLRPDIPVIVEIVIDLNFESRELKAIFIAIDPETGWMPENPMIGLLFPNDDSGRGEGYFSYRIKMLENIQSGAEIKNKAKIVFDWNDPIETPMVINTIDSEKPASHVNTLPIFSESAEFPISWTQTDGNGSGVAYIDIYVSENNDDYTICFENLTSTSAIFTGKMLHTYKFFSIATDNVGNQEMNTGVDAETFVYDLSDVIRALMILSNFKITLENNEAFDLNEDGKIDMHEVIHILQKGSMIPANVKRKIKIFKAAQSKICPSAKIQRIHKIILKP